MYFIQCVCGGGRGTGGGAGFFLCSIELERVPEEASAASNHYNYKNALDVLGFTLGQGDDLLAGGVVSRAAHNQNYPSPNAAHSRYNEL